MRSYLVSDLHQQWLDTDKQPVVLFSSSTPIQPVPVEKPAPVAIPVETFAPVLEDLRDSWEELEPVVLSEDRTMDQVEDLPEELPEVLEITSVAASVPVETARVSVAWHRQAKWALQRHIQGIQSQVRAIRPPVLPRAPQLPPLSLPTLPTFTWPGFSWKAPAVTLPKIQAPRIPRPTWPHLALPRLKLPSWEIPEPPRFQIPRISIQWPKITVPSITLPWQQIYKWGSRFAFSGALAALVMFLAPIVVIETQTRVHQVRQQLASIRLYSRDETVVPPSTPTPPPEPEIKTVEDFFSIEVPRLGISSRVIPNVNTGNSADYESALKIGVAHAEGTGLPGDLSHNKTMYFFAHSTNAAFNIQRYNAQFYALKDTKPGDVIKVRYWGEDHWYEIEETKIVEATDTSYLAPQTERELLVLQTCYPPGTTWKRLVVIATPTSAPDEGSLGSTPSAQLAQ